MANVQYIKCKHDTTYCCSNLEHKIWAWFQCHLGRFDFQEKGCQLGDSCKFCHLCTFQEAGWDIASVQAFYCGLDSKRSEMMLENPPHSAVACTSRRRPSVFVPNMSIAAKPGEKQGQRSSRNSPKTASVGRRIWICPPFQQPGSEKTWRYSELQHAGAWSSALLAIQLEWQLAIGYWY